MHILLLGATGRTGKQVLQIALEKGYHVSCLVRNPKRVPQHPKLSIFEGIPTDSNALKQAMKGCAIIVSVLNISRTSDFPWAPLRTPKTLLSDTMKNVVFLSKHYPIAHLIVCSAWGVGDSRKDIPFWFRWTIDFSNIRFAYKDHERQEEVLRNSGLQYTIVRPVGLINSKQMGEVKVSIHPHQKPNLLVSRKAVAAFLVDCITSPSRKNKTITISNA